MTEHTPLIVTDLLTDERLANDGPATSSTAPGVDAPASTSTVTQDVASDTAAPAKAERGILFWSLILFNFAVVVFLLKWGELFFIPLFAGILLSYTLGPIVDYMVSWKIPRWLSANLAVLAFVALNGAIGYAVWWQAVHLAESLPQTVQRLGSAMKDTQSDETSALSKLNKAAEAVNEVIHEQSAAPAEPDPAAKKGKTTQVVVQPPKGPNSGVFSDMLFNRMITMFSDLGTVASVLLLAYFLLAAGDQFRRKTVSIIGDTLTQKRITVEVLNEIDRSVQKYLGSMFLTNLILGLLTYAVLWLFGFENARVWGLLAGILHVIPYLGTLLTAAGVFITGLQQWGDLSMAASATFAVFIAASLVGTFAQAWILGKIVNINHTAQFVAILFFGWLWGASGLLIAMPLLVVIKVIAARIEVLDPVAQFLKE